MTPKEQLEQLFDTVAKRSISTKDLVSQLKEVLCDTNHSAPLGVKLCSAIEWAEISSDPEKWKQWGADGYERVRHLLLNDIFTAASIAARLEKRRDDDDPLMGGR